MGIIVSFSAFAFRNFNRNNANITKRPVELNQLYQHVCGLIINFDILNFIL